MADRKLTIKLTKKQGELLEAFNNPDLIEILFGGGGRGGKTWGFCEIINMTCIAFPGIAWGVGRKEWVDLQKSSLVTLTKVLHAHGMKKDKDYTLNLQTKELHYTNGSRVFFIPLKQQPTDTEFNFLGGYELTHVFVDEAQEVSRKAIDILKTRLTEKIIEYNLVGKILMGCNPMKGHLYKDFIKASTDQTISPDRVFIQALYTDNPYIDHDKYRANYANADKVTRERLLKGNWEYDDTPGRLFEYDRIIDLQHNEAILGEKYITCDPARQGRDTTIIMIWNGYTIEKTIMEEKSNQRELKDRIYRLSRENGVRKQHIIVDENGLGGGLVDELECQGFINNKKAIEPKILSTPTSELKKSNYENLKTQCYHILSRLVNDGKIRWNGPPDLFSKLVEELDVITQVDIDKDGPFKIIRKEDIIEVIGRSPDVSDAMMMRMFYEIRRTPDLSDVQTVEDLLQLHAYQKPPEVLEFEIEVSPY